MWHVRDREPSRRLQGPYLSHGKSRLRRPELEGTRGRADLEEVGSFSNTSSRRGPPGGQARGDTGQAGGKGGLRRRWKVGALG